MKKSVMILVACICLGITGCGTNAKTDGVSATTQEKTEAVTTDEVMTEETGTTTESASSIQLDEGEPAEYVTSIDMVDYSRDIKTDDGVLLWKVTQNCPDVTIDGSAAAADKINDFYLKEKDAFDAMVEEWVQSTKDTYAELSEEDKAWYAEYVSELEEDSLKEAGLSLEYSLKRADDQCISIVKESYGCTVEHPTNTSREAVVFDTETGEQLTFDNIFEDEDKARSFITEYLTKILKKKYKDVLYDDYEKDIPGMLDDNTWYLSKGGFVIICNEYIITPYATEITEFTIPYSKFDGLVDMYKPDAMKNK